MGIRAGMELVAYIVWLCVIGLIVGAIARLRVPGRQAMAATSNFPSGRRRGITGRRGLLGPRRRWL